MYIMVCYVCKRFRFSNSLDAQPRCGHGSINDMVLNYNNQEEFESNWKVLPLDIQGSIEAPKLIKYG